MIETAWAKAPHPELAAAYDAIFADERPLQRLKRFETLAARNKDHIESHIALAQAALKARLWGEARRHLADAGAREDNANPSPRVARLMAELEEEEHGDLPAARMWLARATTTTTQDAAYVCAACGGEVASWSFALPALPQLRQHRMAPARARAGAASASRARDDARAPGAWQRCRSAPAARRAGPHD